jgi:ERCC4-type nuclease
MATPAAAKKHSKLDKQVLFPPTCCQDSTDNDQRRSLRDSISSIHQHHLRRILDHVSSKYSRTLELMAWPRDRGRK